MRLIKLVVTATMTATALSAAAQVRLQTISPGFYNAEQNHAAANVEAACKVPVFGRFEPLMYSPQVMSPARAMGDYLSRRSRNQTSNTMASPPQVR